LGLTRRLRLPGRHLVFDYARGLVGGGIEMPPDLRDLPMPLWNVDGASETQRQGRPVRLAGGGASPFRCSDDKTLARASRSAGPAARPYLSFPMNPW
jgi:hypothetical protein